MAWIVIHSANTKLRNPKEWGPNSDDTPSSPALFPCWSRTNPNQCPSTPDRLTQIARSALVGITDSVSGLEAWVDESLP